MKKYLLIFHCWIYGEDFAYVGWSTTRIIDASPIDIQEKIDKAKADVDLKKPSDHERSILHQVVPL